MAATILFLPYPSASGTWGSTLLLTTIARACRRAGHRVAFHACAPTVGYIRRLGFDVLEFEGARPRPAASRAVESFYDVCQILGFDDRGLWERVLGSEAEAIAAVRPDAIVSHLRLSAPISAARTEVPLVSLAFWATDPRAQARGDDPLDELARGLASAWSDLAVTSLPELVSWHADVQLATSFPAFEPELAGAPGLVYTGYLGGDHGEPAGSGLTPPARMVLGYLSSAPWGGPRVAEALSRAAARVGAKVWCVTRAGGPSGALPGGGKLFSYLPFDRVLPHAAAVVFHAGHGTSVGALHHGVPALAVPAANYERRYNAGRLQDLGVGRYGEVRDLRSGRLAAHLERLLDDPSVRDATGPARAQSTAYPGTPAAVEAVERLLDGARPTAGAPLN
jgi:UDP:flavonoid glycosyltransferase YjiC (YdhE family)